jgi:cytoskeletal protein CcmA (bactofilin family)
MKATWILIAIGAIALASFFWWGAFRSTTPTAGGDVTLASGSEADGDLVVAGRNVDVQKEIKGDLTAAGANVTMAGPVQGYVMAAGSNVNIDGAVGNDLWAAGANVNVNAAVADNVRLAGNSVILQPQARVGRDAYLAGNSVEVLGRVERNLSVQATEARLASEIGGSVRAYTGALKMMPGAVIRGDLIVHAPTPPDISPQAQVLGSIKYYQEGSGRGWSLVNWLWQWLFIFLVLLILGSATIALFAWWTRRIADRMKQQPGYAMLAGLLGMILIPLICVLLAITIIGIPLAIVLFALYCVALLLSGVFVSYLIGGWLLGRLNRPETSPYARLAAGALVVAFFTSLPWVGGVVQLLVLIIGLGALILEGKDSWRGLPVGEAGLAR